MNRKIYLWGIATIIALFFASCSQTEPENSSNEAEVTFTLGIENAIATRAISDGTGANQITFAIFNEDGTFAGKGPVNNYFGNYVQNGESLTLEQVGATMMFGPNMEAEDAYFASLKTVAGFTLTDAGLTLVDANGKAVVSFAAQSFVDEE